MSEVVAFPGKKHGLFDPAKGGEVADNDHNRNERNGQGPPIGSTAWVCVHCQCFAFYITPDDFRCYECHSPQDFV